MYDRSLITRGRHIYTPRSMGFVKVMNSLIVADRAYGKRKEQRRCV